MATIWIDSRFRGPARSGHGGYVAGLVGSGPASGATVRLRMPPPLETELELSAGTLSGPGGVIATATAADPAALDEAIVEPVEEAEVRAAEEAFAAMTEHPFPTCYGCGPDNKDGLHLRPGRTTERRTATGWRPVAEMAGADGLVAPEYLWAALDCPGGWTIAQDGRPSVLGQLTARIETRPEPDEPCLVMGRWLGEDGRKTFAATTLYGSGGRVLARAHQVWIAVDPAVFN